ncbi:TonB-dependent receptor [Paludibacter sp.]
MLFVSIQVVAQDKITVKGTVYDQTGNETLIGVSVRVNGTTLGTVTDFDGNFTLSDIPKNSTLTISYVGMKSVTREVSSNTTLKILMEPETKSLEEVIVVGYGTARKRDLTGSIVSISGESLKNSPDFNPLKSLQGKVPGLLVTNTGAAGSSPSIRVRGVATTYADTKPLYVVDGMFIDNIDFVNPNDITSIEVLKDPSSLAIFGVQGANGVIIVTTKRSSVGHMNVSYDGYVGMQSLHQRDRVSLTNADQFTMLYNEQLTNMNPAAVAWTGDLLGGGTDWQSLIFRDALITNHSLTVSNATEKSSSVLSLGYFKQDGIVKYNSYQRFNGRWAGDYQVSKLFKLGGNVTVNRWDSDPASASVSNTVKAIPTYAPYAPAEDHDEQNIGSFYTPSPGIQKDVANPVAVMEINKGNTKNYGYRIVGNVYTELNFLNDFSFKITGYGDVGNSFGSRYTPKFDVNNSTSNSSHRSLKTSFSRSSEEYTKYQIDMILNYNKKIAEHRISAMVGYTARVQENQGFSAGADTLINADYWTVPEDMRMLSMGSIKNKTNSDWYDSEAFISYLGRVNYNYADKYLLSLTFRADGSSKFSPNKRWGYFPSVGAAWVASDEGFFDDLKDKIEFLKIKTSWGKLGNDKIGNYLWFPTINPMGQQIVVDGKTYYIPTVSNLVDANLHWEVVSGFDFGFESRMMKDRLSLELGYFTKTTNDLLAYVDPPVAVGAGFAITNAGSVKNSGLEFIIGWKDKIGKVKYNVGINGSTLYNEVLALGNDNSYIVSGSYHRTAVGHPVGAIYGYVQEGIFQNQAEIDSHHSTSWTSKPGDIKYKDINEDGKITDADRDFIGSTIPSFIYGITLGVEYSNFDFSADFNGVAGNSIVNTKKLPSYAQFNYYTSTLNRWHGEGTSKFEPILDTSRGHNFLSSTNLLESGAYFRLRAVQIGYSLPANISKTIGVSKVRCFANAQNPITFKKNSGYTPEIGGGILNGSIDDGSTYPLPSTYTFGLTVNF